VRSSTSSHRYGTMKILLYSPEPVVIRSEFDFESAFTNYGPFFDGDLSDIDDEVSGQGAPVSVHAMDLGPLFEGDLTDIDSDESVDGGSVM